MAVRVAPAGSRLGLGRGEESRGQAAASQARRHPEVLQLAAIAPGPAADTGNDPARVAYEDRQVDVVAEARGGRRLSTDLSLEDLDVVRIRAVLGAEVHGDGSSGVDDLLDQRHVVEIGPHRSDLAVTELGH